MKRFSQTTRLVTLIAAVWLLPQTARAQRGFNLSAASNAAELLPPPRNVRQQIREADEAIAQERYSDAVVRLGDLLRRTAVETLPETAQDYFIDAPMGEGIDGFQESMIEREFEEARPETIGRSQDANTIMRLVRQRIGNLPQAGLEIYELRYGPLGAKRLQEARGESNAPVQPGVTTTQDWHAVEQVRREFFHTEAGYQASYLLAVREWYLGNPLAVVMLLEDLVGHSHAVDQLGDEIIWLHAGATLLGERSLGFPKILPSDAPEELAQLFRTQPTEAVTRWETAVRERFTLDPNKAEPVVNDYALLGARLGRNDLSEGQMPLSNPRWMLETSGSPRQEKTIETETEQLAATGLLPPPSWMPLRVGDQLLMRTTQRLVGVDHRTGKRVWQYPWFSAPESIPEEDPDDPNDLRVEEDPNDILAQRVWNDVPYGQLSSDGQRVYMIDNLNLVESERINPFGMRATRSLQSSKNTLVALDLATEGKLVWRLGVDENEPTSLADAFFLGPPLPVRGRLYVMAELAGEILLVCLNPVDGAELWRQVLVSVESTGITTDPVRRVAGAMPTYHNGLLICPTGAGVTVALDLIDRTFRWVQMYQRTDEPAQHVFRPPPEVSMTRLSQRWATSVAVAKGNHVALTPAESDRLIVVDPLTGQERFRPQPRIKNMYLAGIRDGQYVIVRADRVIGYDLESGAEIWSTPDDLMNSGQRVSGRGVFGKSSYFLPTSNNELIEISTEDGRVLARRQLRFPLGNLIAVGGEIISQATTTLAVAYGQQSLEPTVNGTLLEDPDDFFATVRKAELLLEQDQRDSALDMLGKARQMDPQNDEVILLSVEAMLGALREQETLSNEDIETLKQLIERPEQRAELLVLQISRLTDAAKWKDAFDRILELSELLVERPAIANQQSQILPAHGRSFSLTAWVSARVAQIAANADPETLDSVIQSLSNYLENTRRGGEVAGERMLDHFLPLSDRMASVYEQAFEQTFRRGDWLASERMAWSTKMPTDHDVAGLSLETLLHLAKTYSETSWYEDRALIERVIRSRKLSTEQKQAAEQILDQYKLRGPRRSDKQWPANVSLEWQSSRINPAHALTTNRRYAKTTHLMGRTTQGWQAVSDNNPLALLNDEGIPRPIAIEGLTARNSSDKEITFSGGLMLVLTPSELIAIDLFRFLANQPDETVRWRRSLSPDGQAVAKLRSEKSKFGDDIYRYLTNTRTANADEAQLRLGPILGDRLFLLQGNDLICFDAVNGQTLWRTDIGFPGSGVVARDGRVAVISEQSDQVITLDWYDGRLIETQPLRLGQLMTTTGHHALIVSSYDESDKDFDNGVDLYDPQIVEIFDPIAMKRVQSRIASPINQTDQARSSGYGKLIEGRYFSLLDNAGRLTLWDVLRGEQLIDTKIPIRENLFDLSIIRLENRFLVFPQCKINESTLRSVSGVTVAGGMSVQGTTSVHCIEMIETDPDAADSPKAKVAWSQAFDEPRGVTVHQPFLTPMLILVRGKLYNRSTASSRRELDIWGLDVRTGETLIERIGKQVGTTNPQIETDVRLISHRNQMIVAIQNEFLTFTFSDQQSPETSDTQPDPNSEQAGDVVP
ncbi:outer membrane protein assembly factor BamB family protein [Neorhodopirellula pilleata]|uniref:Outer membrane protein assembly factor BamB n=1 Tax=Neorhodopirellula pilleata TaxID=2714738 RepID=A0A5C6A844_9BACT|nr:PQQ-binding-like beta-propeller repeat protein [Neorhodopirellula pilleata]TWT95557.1 Outer membrane protein assembly factor BamB [Neorhodopirellula pilleata]